MEWRRDLFEVLFLALGEVEHFIGVFEENCAFCFGLGDVEGGGEDSYFGVVYFFDDTLGMGCKYLSTHRMFKRDHLLVHDQRPSPVLLCCLQDCHP
jgi:hypothetical protein